MIERQRGYCADRGQSYGSLERLGAAFRRRLSLAPHERFPGKDLFEGYRASFTVSGNGREHPVEFAVANLPADAEAKTAYDVDRGTVVISLASTTYSALACDDPRALMSLAHECGHADVHTTELIRLAEIPHDTELALLRSGRRHHEVWQDCEWQAFGFAGAVLMPATGLQNLRTAGLALTPSRLMDQYGVSLKAACKRLQIFEARWEVNHFKH